MPGPSLLVIPYELQIQILAELPLQDLLSVSRANRALHAAAQEPALWILLLEAKKGLRLKQSLRRHIVATRVAPGSFDGRDWTPGPRRAGPPEWSVWTLPAQLRSYLRGLLFAPTVLPLTENESGQPEEEVPEKDRIPVHFPTLYRSRCYLEDEMRLVGPHAAFDPENPGRHNDPDDNDDDRASIASATNKHVYPNHLYMSHEHSAKVYATRVRGQWLVSGSRDRTFRIWRLPEHPLNGSLLEYTPEVVYVQEDAHAGSVLCLDMEVREDGTGTIVTGSGDHTVKVWHVEWGTGDDITWEGTRATLVTTLTNHTKTVSGVAITDKLIVSCSHDGRVLVYDRDSLSSEPKLLRDIVLASEFRERAQGYPLGIAVAPDGITALVAGFEHTAVMLPLTKGAAGGIVELSISLRRVMSVHAAEGAFVHGGDESNCEFLQTEPASHSFYFCGGTDDTVVRAVRAFPRLDLVCLASYGGYIQVVDYSNDDATERLYRFRDDPAIFSLDRDGMNMVAAVGEHVAVITYGVGKPYASLLE